MDVLRKKIKAKRKADEAANDVKPWVRGFARFGYFSRGTVHILIGVLSIMAAAGVGEKKVDTTGAFASLTDNPFGEVLLWIIAVGLVGYVMWRIIQVFLDPENKGYGVKGITIRIGYLSGAIVYSVLAFKAFNIALHLGSTGNSHRTVVTRLLPHSYVTLIIEIVGLLVIVFGFCQMVGGIYGKFIKKFNTNEMSSRQRLLNRIVGQFGLITRGVSLMIIGYFLFLTAFTSKPSSVIGLGRIYAEISEHAFGPIFLIAIAIGLMSYGIFQIMKGKNRHMKVV